jgi:allantoinase
MFDQIIRAKNLHIAVDGEKIAEVAPEILAPAKHELKVLHLEALPAVVDAHVHFNEPGHEDWEGISTGSRGLLAGGGAVFVDMPLNSVPVTTTAAALSAKLERMRQSHADYALWGGLTPESLPHLEALAMGGVVGFKAFMSHSGLPEFERSTTETLFEGMRQAAKLGLPVAVHAESDSLTSRLTLAATQTDIRAYLDSRPIQAELEAIGEAINLAAETGCTLHIVHISSAAGVELVSAAKARGVDVSAETCPHYLWFDETDLERLGAVLKCAPPVRSAAELEKLWAVLEQIDIIGSDHSPAPPSMKTSSNFFEIWGGISGVQSTLEVMLTGAASRGLDVGGILPKLSAQPAARFGLSGKGKLAVGFDADIALVEHRPWRLEATDLQYRHAQSPYVGAVLRAKVQSTMLRGQMVWDGRSFAAPQGRWLRGGLEA